MGTTALPIVQAHNIVVNEETNMVYLVGGKDRSSLDICNGGLFMIDVTDPKKPVYKECYGDDGYVHDAQCIIYNGPDTRFTGKEICLCCALIISCAMIEEVFFRKFSIDTILLEFNYSNMIVICATVFHKHTRIFCHKIVFTRWVNFEEFATTTYVPLTSLPPHPLILTVSLH